MSGCATSLVKRSRIALLTAVLAVAVPWAGAADQDAEAALNALRVELQKLVGDAPCANLVHCRVLALGTRPCGGANEYVAYSSITANKDLLESKAFEYGFLHEEVMRSRKEAGGTCEVLPQPRAMCVDRRCRLDSTPH